MEQTAGCGCAGGGRRHTKKHLRRHTKKHLRRHTKKRGGGMIENAVLAAGVLGLYSYFTRGKK